MMQNQQTKQELFLETANLILSYHPIKTLADTDEMYLYDEEKGIWDKEGELFITDLIFDLNPQFSKADIQEVIAKIRHQSRFSREFFNPPRFLGLKNGTYNLESGEPIGHSPDQHLTRSINVQYYPDEYPDEFVKFLYDVVGPEQIDLIFEIIGYCLMSGYPYHKAFMFVGEGANGKTTFFQVLHEFFGTKNICSIDLQDFERQFNTINLYGKMINLSDDLPSKPVRYTGVFKKLTGGSIISARNLYQKPITFVNSAKMFFATNEPPAIIYDNTNAIWRRIMVINFPNEFLGDKADKKIIEKLTTSKELSGIFNLALEGITRLRNKGGFEETIRETRRIYTKISNSVKAFTDDKLEAVMGEEINHSELYHEYLNYCVDRGLQAKAKNVFTQWLPRAMPSAERRRSGNAYFWMGIKWK